MSRNPRLAAVATLGAIGLGQLYNGNLRQAISIYLASLLVYPLLSTSVLASSFPVFLSVLLVVPALFVAVMVHAYRQARVQTTFTPRTYNKWYVYLAICLINGFVLSPVMKTIVSPLGVRAFKIPSGTMIPTLRIGDHLISDLRVYSSAGPTRGDIVVFRFPKDEKTLFIKRVLGLPGEKIETRAKSVLINEKPLNDPWGSFGPREDRNRENYGPILLGPDEYFLMGDNRDNSFDSRMWGPVKRNKIIGRAKFLYWADDKSRIGKSLE
jgi:signal peptidase I